MLHRQGNARDSEPITIAAVAVPPIQRLIAFGQIGDHWSYVSNVWKRPARDYGQPQRPD